MGQKKGELKRRQCYRGVWAHTRQEWSRGEWFNVRYTEAMSRSPYPSATARLNSSFEAPITLRGCATSSERPTASRRSFYQTFQSKPTKARRNIPVGAWAETVTGSRPPISMNLYSLLKAKKVHPTIKSKPQFQNENVIRFDQFLDPEIYENWRFFLKII